MEDFSARAAPFREVLAAQKMISHELFRTAMPKWIHLDLTMGQLKTLAALAARQEMNISALAETLEVSKPTASVLVDQLVQLGYAERTEDAEDRRRTLVAPTQAGSDLVAQLRQSGPQDRMVRWLETMNPADLAALTRGLTALAAIAERDIAQSPAAAG
ncbi:MAG TPA: MarR family transcriptional regulator [Ktedonobacterales bacterium]|jgi:DNA-binding MarR family transcriptional regulator